MWTNASPISSHTLLKEIWIQAFVRVHLTIKIIVDLINIHYQAIYISDFSSIFVGEPVCMLCAH